MKKITLDYPDIWDKEIMRAAEKDGHSNRSAIIRKAIALFLETESQKVASETTKEEVSA